MKNVTISRGHITWDDYDRTVESVIVFKVDGYEYSDTDLDLVTGKEVATFKTEDSETLIHEIFVSHEKLTWLWDI
jgi:uncharacterized transporter YbjL